MTFRACGYKSKEHVKDQESIQIPHLTYRTSYRKMTKTQENIKIQERQEVIPFPAGDLNAARNRQGNMAGEKKNWRA